MPTNIRASCNMAFLTVVSCLERLDGHDRDDPGGRQDEEQRDCCPFGIR
jgi:hypothetical protein